MALPAARQNCEKDLGQDEEAEMSKEVKIEKPAEFYDEVKVLIGEYYNAHVHVPPDSFGSRYPVVYGLYLQIAALGLRKEDR